MLGFFLIPIEFEYLSIVNRLCETSEQNEKDEKTALIEYILISMFITMSVLFQFLLFVCKYVQKRNSGMRGVITKGV